MTSIKWQSNDQRDLEWRVAKSCFEGSEGYVKIKPKKRNFGLKVSVDYRDPENRDGEKVHIQHPFIHTPEGQILALAGSGRILDEGAFGSVTLAEDEDGTLYTIKAAHGPGSITETEKAILRDVNIAKESFADPVTGQQMVLMKYLGTALNGLNFNLADGDNDDQRKEKLQGAHWLGLKCVDAVLAFHQGTSSDSQTRYLHKDIKPANLLFASDRDVNCNVALIDFGVSEKASLERWDGRKSSNYLSGTPDYMAPEILTSQDYSFLSDIYALGVTLSELLPQESPLQSTIIKQMVSKDPICRPNLELVKLAFLMEIYSDSSDDTISETLHSNNCRITDVGLAKQLSQKLKKPTSSINLTYASNCLERVFYQEEELEDKRLTQGIYQNLADHKRLRQAVVVLGQLEEFSQPDWDELFQGGETLWQAVVALGGTGAFTYDDWETVKACSEDDQQQINVRSRFINFEEFKKEVRVFRKYVRESSAEGKKMAAKTFQKSCQQQVKGYLLYGLDSDQCQQATATLSQCFEAVKQHRHPALVRQAARLYYFIRDWFKDLGSREADEHNVALPFMNLAETAQKAHPLNTFLDEALAQQDIALE